ncbi:MAG: hypothetical protein MI892_02180 [Desulfobacterales bacterium]|nr:hypothetical protein [Desulfobacterales bacterium]
MRETNWYFSSAEVGEPMKPVFKCMHCNQDKPGWAKSLRADDPAHRKCMLCERYFKKNRLFLNNIG